MSIKICCCRIINNWCCISVGTYFYFCKKNNLYSSRGCCFGGGYLLVANDIAPAYTGIVFGISNTLATIPGIVSPYVVGALTEKVSLILLKY